MTVDRPNFVQARLNILIERAEERLRSLGVNRPPSDPNELPSPEKRAEIDARIHEIGLRAAMLEHADVLERDGLDEITVNAVREHAMTIPPDFGKQP